MSASAGDPTVNATQNSYFLRQQLDPIWTEELDVVATSGGHNANGHYDALDTNAFFDRALARNLAPVARIDLEVIEPGVVRVDATSSDDLDGTIVGVEWDFGDGTIASGAVVEHAFGVDGRYNISLAVTDDAGSTSYAVTAVDVDRNDLPVAVFAVVQSDRTVTLDASASFDPDGVIVDYLWDFGDGANATGDSLVMHSFAEPGTYVVTLVVTDAVGAQGTVAQTVTIETTPGEPPPGEPPPGEPPPGEPPPGEPPPGEL
jgi:PKD repeat protein